MRNSSATMIAAFMFGSVTLYRRCHQVAPSTLAASCSSSGTWARPASSSSDMNGVVFQISDRQMTTSDGQRSPNQSVSPRPGPRQPVVDEAGVEGEGVLPGEGGDDGDDPVGDEDRRAQHRPESRSALCITMAKAKPMTSSTTTVMTVMSTRGADGLPPQLVGEHHAVVLEADELRGRRGR